MLRDHVDKVPAVLLALVLVGLLCVGATYLGRVEQLANRVRANAGIVKAEVNSDALPPGSRIPAFQRGSVRGPVQQQWEDGLPRGDYPTDLLTGR